MSSPHVAGIAALLRQKFPAFSPMEIKSAIMTTAYQTTRTGASAGRVFGGPFDFGAGHVDPSAALNPGLVLDSNADDWQRFMCGIGEVAVRGWSGPCSACLKSYALCDPSSFNTPAGECRGKLGVSKTGSKP